MLAPKSWRKSRTILLNAIALVLALATALASPEMAALGISPDVARGAAIAVALLGVINVQLRLMTTQPIARSRAARRTVQ